MWVRTIGVSWAFSAVLVAGFLVSIGNPVSGSQWAGLVAVESLLLTLWIGLVGLLAAFPSRFFSSTAFKEYFRLQFWPIALPLLFLPFLARFFEWSASRETFVAAVFLSLGGLSFLLRYKKAGFNFTTKVLLWTVGLVAILALFQGRITHELFLFGARFFLVIS